MRLYLTVTNEMSGKDAVRLTGRWDITDPDDMQVEATILDRHIMALIELSLQRTPEHPIKTIHLRLQYLSAGNLQEYGAERLLSAPEYRDAYHRINVLAYMLNELYWAILERVKKDVASQAPGART